MEEQRSSINAITKASAEIPKTIDNSMQTSKVTKVGGTIIPITYNPCQFKPKYVDEYTGELLEPSLISDAITDELDYFNDHVWRIEDKASMLGIKEHVFVRSRWVMCNKGDHIEPDMRARLVACEVYKEGKNDFFHASTPPLEDKKLTFARYASERTRKSKPLRLSFVDIRKTYFNGVPRRDVFMSLPRNLGYHPTSLRSKFAVCTGLATLV